MTIIEYRPSANPGQWKQPDHLSDRPSYESKRLGRIVSTAGVPHLSYEEAEELFLEVTQDIQTLASRMSSQEWDLPEYRRMKAKKARWGAVHQALTLRHSAVVKNRKRRRHLESRTFSDYFCDIAKEKLSKQLFNQLMEMAKERHSESLAELAALVQEVEP